MMTKEDHIQYWLNASLQDWGRANILSNNKDFVFALFCLHLSVEKLLKALWVKTHESNIPPRIHNLLILAEQSSLILDELQKEFLDQLNVFQLEGRYPDYQGKVYKIATKDIVDEFFMKAKNLEKCILERMD